MGFYIETPGSHFNKAEIICREHGGRLVETPTYESFVPNNPDETLVAVVTNLQFDAAMVVVDEYDLRRVLGSVERGDNRPLKWVSIPTETARELAPRAFEED